MTPSCPKHPDQQDFYVYDGKPARCKACVQESRQKWLSKKKGDAGLAPVTDGPTPRLSRQERPDPLPASGRARSGPDRWHWSWGRPPEGWQGSPSASPDAWGPYKGMTDGELRFRKSRRGQTGLAFGYAWLSPEEWRAQEERMASRAEQWAKKRGP